MTYAEMIKELCQTRGISVRKLETACGFGNGYINRLGDTMPTDRAAKITEYLGLPTDYFMPNAIKKGSASQSPTIDELIALMESLPEPDLKELLSFAKYIQSKH